MKRIIAIVLSLSIAFVLLPQISYAQISDRGFEEMYFRKLEEAYAKSGKKGKGKEKKEKPPKNVVRTVTYSPEELEEIKREDEIERADSRRVKDNKEWERRTEIEGNRKQTEFTEGKKELDRTLRSFNRSSTESYFSDDLRGLSSDQAVPIQGSKDVNSHEASAKSATSSNNPRVIPYEVVKRLDQEAIVWPTPAYYIRSDDNADQENILDKLDRVQEEFDRWAEIGQHKVLNYVGDKLMSFTRSTITKSSALGKQLLKMYDIANEIAEVRKLDTRIVTRSVDASYRSIITGDGRYAEDALYKGYSDVTESGNNALVKKGLLPPNAKALDKKGQDVTKLAAEAWIQNRISK